ncbi:MAG: MFS transporter [Chloroflexi bacterium]|nr:MFS transporter [Chloroflexota bacterium]
MGKQQTLRTFYWIVITQTLSMVGSQMSSFAVGIWVYGQTGNVTPLALVALFSTLPLLVAQGFAGVLADRYDRRLIMALADTGQAIATVLLLLSFASGQFQLWHLYAVSFIQAVFRVFQSPAFGASVTMLVPDEQRERANAIMQLMDPAAGLIAPAVAGLLYAAIGVTGVIAIDLLTFVIAVGVMLALRIPRPPQTAEGRKAKGSLLYEMTVGFRYVWQHKPLLVLLLFAAGLNFLLNGMGVLNTAYVLARTENNEAALGVLMSVLSAGGIAGAIFIGAWGGTRPRIHTIMPALILVGVTVMIFGMARHPVLMGVCLFVAMFMVPLANVSLISMMQTKVAPDLQGRVFAFFGQIAMMATPLAFLLVGPAADQVFEPAVGQAGWDAVAPLVGSSVGAGMGLMIVIAGLGVLLASVFTYTLPAIRHLEANLPDYTPAAKNAPTAAHQEAPVSVAATD